MAACWLTSLSQLCESRPQASRRCFWGRPPASLTPAREGTPARPLGTLAGPKSGEPPSLGTHVSNMWAGVIDGVSKLVEAREEPPQSPPSASRGQKSSFFGFSVREFSPAAE